MLIGDYHAVADAVKNGLHELALMLQFVNGFFHFVLDPLRSPGAALAAVSMSMFGRKFCHKPSVARHFFTGYYDTQIVGGLQRDRSVLWDCPAAQNKE